MLGANYFSSAYFGQDYPDDNAGMIVQVTGVSATGAAGSVAVKVGTSAVATGASSTGAVGTLSVSVAVTVPLTGVSSAGSAGTVTAGGGFTVSVTGVSGTGTAGTAAAGLGCTTSVTGVSCVCSVGSVTISLPNDITDASADLMGLNGQEAWESAVLGLIGLQTEMMLDQFYVFGVDGARVMNVRGAILISRA